VWSGATGAVIYQWDGAWPDGLFGHWVLAVPDLSNDGRSDVVIAAPHAQASSGGMRGIVVARSPKTGEEIWSHLETDRTCENLGWDMALADDEDGDGLPDLFVGAPGGESGRVYLLSGKDGTTLRTLVPTPPANSFGWFLATVDDLDGDRHADLAVGAPFAAGANGAPVGAAFVMSSASGKELYRWMGSDPRAGFGVIVAAVADIDGDGKREVAVASPGTEDQTRQLPGELTIYSSTTGKPMRHFSGTHPGEQYGRMVAATDDLDGDGVADLAISAPWSWRGADERVGRIELRSGKNGDRLGDLFGEDAEDWFGWHVVRAPDPDKRHRPALLISSLRRAVDGKERVGVLDLYVLDRLPPSPTKAAPP